MIPPVKVLLAILGLAAAGFASSASGALVAATLDGPDRCAAVADEGTGSPHPFVEAAFATMHLEELNAIYGEQNFPLGASIELLFSPVQKEVGLLSIQNREDLLSVLGLGTAQSPVINLIFVDTVNWCGFYSPDIVGCTNSRGNTFVLESDAAASSMGTELLAHELGHLLGLRHVGGLPNLMNTSLNGDTSLTPDQLATISESPFVQGFDPIRFIRINPVVVVPEPSASVYLLLAAFLVIGRRRH